MKEYFKGIKEHLLSLGFQETSLPYRMESDTPYPLSIVQVKDESELYPEVNPTMYSITHRRYDDTQFRGQLPNPEIVDLILKLTYEI